MVEAARSSLKQNKMPLPPWRSLAYLQAKWQSPHQRKSDSAEHNSYTNPPIDHKKCAGQLKRLHTLLLSEIEVERTLKPYNRESRVKSERRRYASFHQDAPENNLRRSISHKIFGRAGGHFTNKILYIANHAFLHINVGLLLNQLRTNCQYRVSIFCSCGNFCIFFFCNCSVASCRSHTFFYFLIYLFYQSMRYYVWCIYS